METITKTSRYFAADMIPAVNQYEHMGPSEMLAELVNRSRDHGAAAMSYSQADREQLGRLLPKQMVGMKEQDDGRVGFYSSNVADFLGQGTAGSNILGSGIMPVLAYDTIMEGAKAFACCRDMLTVVRMKSETQTFPFMTKVGYASPKSYSAEAMDLAQDIGKKTASAQTYGVSCSVAGELLADAQGDILAAALREIGATMEQTLERTCIQGLVGESAQSATAALTTGELKALILANGTVGAAGFRPDAAIVSPMFAASMMAQFVPAYNPIAQQWVAGSNILADWGGMKIGRSGIAASTAANWRWTSANDTGALVLDTTKAGYLGIREDMAVDEFDDVIKYLKRPVAISRFVYAPAVDDTNSKRTNGNAVCAITATA